MTGPGKYDDLCTEVRTKVNAGAVVLIIAAGDRGTGFSVQAPVGFIQDLPDILRRMADEIDQDLRRGIMR